MTPATDDPLLRAWGAEVLRGGTRSLDEWRASRDRGVASTGAGGGASSDAAEAPASRALTVAEIEVLRAFNAAYRQLGLDRGVHRAVVGGGMAAALRRRSPGAGEVAGETTPEAAWAEIGAVAALGALLVSDATTRRKRPRRHPAGAGFEPLELARMSNRDLLTLLLRRLARRYRRRGAKATIRATRGGRGAGARS